MAQSLQFTSDVTGRCAALPESLTRYNTTRYTERLMDNNASDCMSLLTRMRCPVHNVVLVPGYPEMLGTDDEYIPLRCSSRGCAMVAKLTQGSEIELLPEEAPRIVSKVRRRGRRPKPDSTQLAYAVNLP